MSKHSTRTEYIRFSAQRIIKWALTDSEWMCLLKTGELPAYDFKTRRRLVDKSTVEQRNWTDEELHDIEVQLRNEMKSEDDIVRHMDQLLNQKFPVRPDECVVCFDERSIGDWLGLVVFDYLDVLNYEIKHEFWYEADDYKYIVIDSDNSLETSQTDQNSLAAHISADDPDAFGRVTQAPDTIKPINNGGFPSSLPQKNDPQNKEDLSISISGAELTKRWAVPFEAICDFARQEKLIPYNLKSIQTVLDWDYSHLMQWYSEKQREDYLSGWLYRPSDVEAFETQYRKIIEGWQVKTTLEKIENNDVSEDPNSLVLNGDHWEISYQGKKTTIKNLIGLKYIAILLERPGEVVSCIALSHAVNPPNITTMTINQAAAEELHISTISRDVKAINTPEARSKLMAKYRELENDKEKADFDFRREEIEEEQDQILKTLKERNFKDPMKANAQSNIKKALDRAYKALKKLGMESLAEYLDDNIKPDGNFDLVYKGSHFEIYH